MIHREGADADIEADAGAPSDTDMMQLQIMAHMQIQMPMHTQTHGITHILTEVLGTSFLFAGHPVRSMLQMLRFNLGLLEAPHGCFILRRRSKETCK